jgi:FkbM family methyltransferase
MLFRAKQSSRPRLPLPDVAAATELDIIHCFRLLLGRNPNPKELRGHMSRIGEKLDGVVASYLGSLEFSRRQLLARDHMGQIELARLPEFSLYLARDDAAVGRHVRAQNYERDVTLVFRRLLRPGMGVVDIGANIGYFTMLSAVLVGAGGFVLAIEPNPRNVRLLEASRRCNAFGHVLVAQVAAGPAPGLLVLHASHSNGTTSELPESAEALLAAETVPRINPDALLPPGRRIDLIKVDVEGAEYNALLGCGEVIARDHPTIISEFSPDLMPGISGVSGPDYLRWLLARGYRLSVIEPDGTQTAADTWQTVMATYAARGTDHIDIVASAA